MTPWLGATLGAFEACVMLRNTTQDVLGGVDPRHWIIPWGSSGWSNFKGAALCEIAELRSLCLSGF